MRNLDYTSTNFGNCANVRNSNSHITAAHKTTRRSVAKYQSDNVANAVESKSLFTLDDVSLGSNCERR